MRRRDLICVPLALALTGVSAARVARIVVWKAARRLSTLDAAGNVLKTYHIALGPHPAGHKTEEGDGRTPEGAYVISGRNRASGYHRSLKISYPNATDRAQAKARGVSPGGDIFIHGQPNGTLSGGLKIPYDWTAGCIAVSNNDIDDLWASVADGTPIDIKP
ncbi:hypothetical protein AEAC466_03200 [Asticcacaulis sp. AC466]|uniref:L,D-transpeptidase family protein n=1 Tax=Asticcacaulis sp. AC466 TaxID=1282362 RepID=UPI0003C3E29B|nr:L,D-transpeptidase family protein [Asticcacaulis sp. AC466]ESQ86216.1 hypothetical protein AEAC466_03200 [Asticcacaulis sp. AC466]